MNSNLEETFWSNINYLTSVRYFDSDRQLCDRAGVNYSSFRTAKSRGSLPSADSLIRLASALNISAEHLLGVLPEKDTMLKQSIKQAVDKLEVDDPILGVLAKILGVTC